MQSKDVCQRLAIGALAGGIATALLQLLRTADQKIMPEAEAPMKEDPGKFMVQKTEQLLPESTSQKIPEKTEAVAAKSLGFAYGITFGSLYAAARPRGGRAWLDGALFGLGTWAVGFLGWLPATGLMPPIWKHQPKQIARPVVEHAAFGVAAVAAYNWLVEQFKL